MRLVDTSASLQAACTELQHEPLYYLDTEFEGARAGALLCLIQISCGKTVFLIDPLRVRALDPLTTVLANPEATWVVHAGGQDVPSLSQRLGLQSPPRVFDTQVAWALLSPEFCVSLAYLQFKLLGLRSSKAHQANDWKRRPLSQSQLEYAASDIAHLPELYAQLQTRAQQKAREQLVLAASHDTVWPEPELRRRLRLDSFRGAWQLDRYRQAGLRFVVDWYNGLTPAQRERAPQAKALLSIAHRMPATAAELARVKGVPQRWCAEHGAQFAAGLVRAGQAARAEDFVAIEPPPYATYEQIRLDGWLAAVRAEVCVKLGVAPELALPNRVMRDARNAILEAGDPQALLDRLCSWRRELVADAYLAQCQRTPLPVELVSG